MSTLVKNQHYVWRNYLKPWTTKSQLFCYRQKANKLFGTNVTGIASETFFYRVERLSSDDLAYLQVLINRNPSDEIRDIHNNTIRLFQMPFLLRDQFEAMSKGRSLSAKLNKVITDAEKTAGEYYHTMTEQGAATILEKLKIEDCSFFSDKEQALEFAHYISHQFFRTPKLKALLNSIENPFPNLDLNRTWFFESHIYADNVGSGIYVNRDAYRFLFLRNKTEIPFITSDQPVSNLHGEHDKTIRLYYPLSPNLAVVFFEDRESVFRAVSDLDVTEVERYNQLLLDRSFDQIYSNDKAYLTTFTLKNKSVVKSLADKA